MELQRIYLDNAATTPVDQRVLETMLPYFSEHYGNPSSIHTFGQEAESAMDNARETVAQIFNCQPKEIIFTSCGSESDNLALRGAAFAAHQARNANHLLITPVEHHAVSRTAQQLAERHGFELEYIPVDQYGQVHPDVFRRCLREDTALVSVIYANNEIGTINPIAAIGEICWEWGIPFHTDGVQAAAYLPVDVNQLNVDLLAIGAHKFYGPKGVGALYIRDGTPLVPTQTGGGQEYGIRAGTSNTPYIVGLAEALRLANEERQQRTKHVLPLRDAVIEHTLDQIPNAQLTGHPKERMPNHASFVFNSVDGNALLMMLDVEGFACSSGSACKTGNPEPSDVLTALGFSDEWALGSLRVTLGMQTKSEEINSFNRHLPGAVQRIRQLIG
jgi:cysteine desulfurase